jgi:hypothetical protein
MKRIIRTSFSRDNRRLLIVTQEPEYFAVWWLSSEMNTVPTLVKTFTRTDGSFSISNRVRAQASTWARTLAACDEEQFHLTCKAWPTIMPADVQL